MNQQFVLTDADDKSTVDDQRLKLVLQGAQFLHNLLHCEGISQVTAYFRMALDEIEREFRDDELDVDRLCLALAAVGAFIAASAESLGADETEAKSRIIERVERELSRYLADHGLLRYAITGQLGGVFETDIPF